jgi:hypothetical protein
MLRKGQVKRTNVCKGQARFLDTWEEHLSPSSLSSEKFEGLMEKVGTFGLQSLRKNLCDAAKKQARKARFAENPSGGSNYLEAVS